MATRAEFRKRFRAAITAEERRLIWAEALESGLWPQTKGSLRDEDGFCCLGVGEDLAHGLRLKTSTTAVVLGTGGLDTEEDLDDLLSEATTCALGLRRRGGEFRGGSLHEANDGGATFPEIAALIRQPPPGLLAKEADHD